MARAFLFRAGGVADWHGKRSGSDVGHEATASMRCALGFRQLDHPTPEAAQERLDDRA